MGGCRNGMGWCSGLLPGLLVALCLGWTHPIQAAQSFRIACASSFAGVLKEILQSYPRPKNIQFEVIQGSTGKLYSQIKQGAPFHLFLAADEKHPKLLQKVGLGQAPFFYAGGILAIWKPGSRLNSGKALSLSQLKTLLGKGKIAVANPRHAPYGKAGMEFLQRLERLDSLGNSSGNSPSSSNSSKSNESTGNIGNTKSNEGSGGFASRLVFAPNVAGAFLFTKTQKDLTGLVSLSHLLSEKVQPVDFFALPKNSYPPLDQYGTVLKQGADEPELQKFVHFLQQQVTRTIIEKSGFRGKK